MPRREMLRLAYVVVGGLACLAFALMGAAPAVCYLAGLSVGAQLVGALEAWSRRKPTPRPPRPVEVPAPRISAPWWAAR
jgi:hypothetical protein